LTSASPDQGHLGQTLDVILSGSGLNRTVSLDFGPDIVINNFAVDSDTQVTANLTIETDATLGSRNVLVTTTNGPEITDQTQLSDGGDEPVRLDLYEAQTFQAGLTGILTTVDVKLRRSGDPPNPIEVQIRNCTAGDLPGNTIFASASKDPAYVPAVTGEVQFEWIPPTTIECAVRPMISMPTADAAPQAMLGPLGSERQARSSSELMSQTPEVQTPCPMASQSRRALRLR
jgi:hypothetical protein